MIERRIGPESNWMSRIQTIKILPAVGSTCFLLLATAVSFAQDPINMSFDNGSVIIYCAAPSKEDQISSAVSLEAFPLWMANLQEEAHEGRVARAIHARNQRIMTEAVSTTGVDGFEMIFEKTCQLIEIGPVAIQPMN